MKTEGISLVTAGMGSTAASKKAQPGNVFESFMAGRAPKTANRDFGKAVDAAEKVSVAAPVENRTSKIMKKGSGSDVMKNGNDTMRSMDDSVKDTLKQNSIVPCKPAQAASVKTVDLSEASEQVMDAMGDTFGLSEEDLVDIMELLGIGITDLLFQFQNGTVKPIDGQAVKQLVMGVHGIEDSAIFLTSEQLNTEMAQLKEQFADVLAETFGVAPEELDKVSESLQMDFREQFQTFTRGEALESGMAEPEMPVADWTVQETQAAEVPVVSMPTAEIPVEAVVETNVPVAEAPVTAMPEMEMPTAEMPVTAMADWTAEIPAAEEAPVNTEMPMTAEMPVAAEYAARPQAAETPVRADFETGMPVEAEVPEILAVPEPIVQEPIAVMPGTDEPMAEIAEPQMPDMQPEVMEAEMPLTDAAEMKVPMAKNEPKAEMSGMAKDGKDMAVSGQREGLSVIVEDYTGRDSQDVSKEDTAVRGHVSMQNPTDGNFEGGNFGGRESGQQDIQGSQIPAETVSLRRDDRPDVPANLFVEKLTEAVQESFQAESGAETVSMARIVEQVVNQVRIRLMPETTNMELQLHPASLGRVNIQVSAANGVTRAAMVVESQAAKEALESQLITLKETFEEQGLKVDSVEVTVSEFGLDHNKGQNMEQQNQNPGNRRFRPEAGAETDTEETADTHETASERRDINSVVDYTA